MPARRLATESSDIRCRFVQLHFLTGVQRSHFPSARVDGRGGNGSGSVTSSAAAKIHFSCMAMVSASVSTTDSRNIDQVAVDRINRSCSMPIRFFVSLVNGTQRITKSHSTITDQWLVGHSIPFFRLFTATSTVVTYSHIETGARPQPVVRCVPAPRFPNGYCALLYQGVLQDCTEQTHRISRAEFLRQVFLPPPAEEQTKSAVAPSRTPGVLPTGILRSRHH